MAETSRSERPDWGEGHATPANLPLINHMHWQDRQPTAALYCRLNGNAIEKSTPIQL